MGDDEQPARPADRLATIAVGLAGAVLLAGVIAGLLAVVTMIQSDDSEPDREPSAPATTTTPPATTLGEADRKALAAQLAAAGSSPTAALPDLAAATADGFVPVGTPEPRRLATLVRWDRVDGRLDIDRPELVAVDGEDPARPVVAVGYFVTGEDPPDGFVGDEDVWDEESALCGLAPAGTGCATASSPGWTLRAWVVDGHENPDGVFAYDNPDHPRG